MSRKRRAKHGAAGPASDAGTGIATPHVARWLPPVLFGLLTVVLFSDFVFSNGMLLGSDTLNLGYVSRAFYAEQLSAGSFPRWAPGILGGIPFLEALSGGDALYPTSLLLVAMEPFRALGWKLVLHIFLAGLFMYGWMRTLGASRAAALLSGTAFMLAPFLVGLVRPGHDGKIFVTALTPLLYWVVERFFVRPRVGTFSVVALVVSLILFTTHFQMAYFLFGSVGLYAAFRAVQTARRPPAVGTGPGSSGLRVGAARFALFLAASLTGVAGAAVQFVPAAQYVTEHSRRTQTTGQAAGDVGAAWSSSWSLHPEEALGLVIPEFAGNNAGGSAWAGGTYWGRNFLKDNAEYGGILVLLLAAVSFTGAPRRGLRWFFTGLGVVAFLFALGRHTPVWGVFYALVPGIRMFRSPSMAIFLFGFAASTLAGLGLDRLFHAATDGDGWPTVRRVLWGAAGTLAVLALLVTSGAVTAFWTTVVYPDIGADGLAKLAYLTPFLVRSAWLATALVAVAAGLAQALHARRLPPTAVLAALVVLAAFDALRVDAAFVRVIDFRQWSAPTPEMQALLERERGSDEPFRLLSFVDRAQDVRPALHGIELAAGHHPNDLARYRALIGMVGSDIPRNLFNPKIERLLNVRYLLWPDHNGPGPEEDAVVSRSMVDGRPWQTLHARPGLPRARLVARAVVVPDDAQVAYMLSEAFQPEDEVVLAQAPPVALDGGPVEGGVTWEERTPEALRLAVTSDRPALLVVADNWFPAWRATVDGQEAPVLRAYHTLRAVPVPAGTHTVSMVYHSAGVARTLWVTIVTLSLLFAGLAFGWLRDRRASGEPAPG